MLEPEPNKLDAWSWNPGHKAVGMEESKFLYQCIQNKRSFVCTGVREAIELEVL